MPFLSKKKDTNSSPDLVRVTQSYEVLGLLVYAWQERWKLLPQNSEATGYPLKPPREAWAGRHGRDGEVRPCGRLSLLEALLIPCLCQWKSTGNTG